MAPPFSETRIVAKHDFLSQMFGVQPPQTLYHTRHSSNRAQSTERSSPPEREASVSAGRNVNQSPYLIKGSKQSKHRRDLSQSESIRPLLDSEEAGSSSGKRGSVIYMHYRSSLDSLSRIIDRVSFFYPVQGCECAILTPRL
jgi:hypothetical protein